MWKSDWGWLRAARDPQERQPRAPQLFERLEPRLLLSVVWETVQPTNPATPEEFVSYLNQQAQESTAEDALVTTDGGSVVTLATLPGVESVPYVPTADQTSIFMSPGDTGMKANVILTFDPGHNYYNVRSWGTIQQVGNTFTVNAEVERLEGATFISELATSSHEYDLGALPAGDYVFEFRAWDQPVESREFRPGAEQWAPYVPTDEQTVISMISDDAGTRATVALTFPDAGYQVTDWGTIREMGGRFYVNAQVERWTGPSSTVITKVSHEYDFGQITGGSCEFAFYASGQYVESRWFMPGWERWVPYVPTAEQTGISVVPGGTGTKATVALAFGWDHAYIVREWGTVHQVGNTFTVNAEVERLEGIVVSSSSWTSTHEYDLGAVPAGDYVFEFRVWDQPIESQEFHPGTEEWVPYIPTAAQMNILVMADGAGGTKARAAFVFADAGYRVHDWGTVQQTGNEFSVDAQVEKWTGGAATAITRVSHDYDLGSLPDGYYVFQFNAWQLPVRSRDFTTPVSLRPVYRFWSPVFLRHFYTLSTGERDKLINNYSQVWTYEQVAYYAFAENTDPDTEPVYRFWSDTLSTHFYTANEAERDKLIANYAQTWAYEGIAFYAYPTSLGSDLPLGTTSVYRLWSARLGTHFFTTSQMEMNKLLDLSPGLWYLEGAGWWGVRPGGS